MKNYNIPVGVIFTSNIYYFTRFSIEYNKTKTVYVVLILIILKYFLK